MIRRTYQCNNCEQYFSWTGESADPDPACPNPACDAVLEWRPQSIAIGGSHASKAADLTQKIMEEDYGFSNFRDNAKPGENAIIPHHETKVETEMVTRELIEQNRALQGDPAKMAQFWGGNAGQSSQMSSMTGQSMIAMSKVGPQGYDPMALLHKGVKSGKVPTPQQMMRIEASDVFVNPARK